MTVTNKKSGLFVTDFRYEGGQQQAPSAVTPPPAKVPPKPPPVSGRYCYCAKSECVCDTIRALIAYGRSFIAVDDSEVGKRNDQ